MTLSFPIDDLLKSFPEATGLNGSSGDVLIDALRKVQGKLEDGAAIRVSDGVVTLDIGELPSADHILNEALAIDLNAAVELGEVVLIGAEQPRKYAGRSGGSGAVEDSAAGR